MNKIAKYFFFSTVVFAFLSLTFYFSVLRPYYLKDQQKPYKVESNRYTPLSGGNYEASVANLERELGKVRYCSSDSDCVIVPVACPYDCGNPMNKKEVERMKKLPGNLDCHSDLMSSSGSTCRYDGGVSCINGACTMDWPKLKPEEMLI